MASAPPLQGPAQEPVPGSPDKKGRPPGPAADSEPTARPRGSPLRPWPYGPRPGASFPRGASPSLLLSAPPRARLLPSVQLKQQPAVSRGPGLTSLSPQGPILWVERKMALWAIQVSGGGTALGGPCLPWPRSEALPLPAPGHRGHYQLPGDHAPHLPQLQSECPAGLALPSPRTPPPAQLPALPAPPWAPSPPTCSEAHPLGSPGQHLGADLPRGLHPGDDQHAALHHHGG